VNLNNLKTGKRMFFGFGIIISMLPAITAISWLEIVSISRITATTSSIRTQTVSQSASVAETRATLEQIRKNLEQLDGLISQQAECVSQSSSSNEEMVANIRSVVGILQKNFV